MPGEEGRASSGTRGRAGHPGGPGCALAPSARATSTRHLRRGLASSSSSRPGRPTPTPREAYRPRSHPREAWLGGSHCPSPRWSRSCRLAGRRRAGSRLQARTRCTLMGAHAPDDIELAERAEREPQAVLWQSSPAGREAAGELQRRVSNAGLRPVMVPVDRVELAEAMRHAALVIREARWLVHRRFRPG